MGSLKPRESPSRTMPWKNGVLSLLDNAIKDERSLLFYPLGQDHSPLTLSCATLYQQAQKNAQSLQTLPNWHPERICIIHLDDHQSNIQWFWSVLLAGGIPAMSAPFASPKEARTKIEHLSDLLSNPIWLTTQSRLQDEEFAPLKTSNFFAVEDLAQLSHPDTSAPPSFSPGYSTGTAVIMFTSGSSGASKAVPLSHEQLRACLEGKACGLSSSSSSSSSSSDENSESKGPILNWIGQDHVAGLVEGHLRALFEGVDQVHVEAADIVGEPARFLEVISRHRVMGSFAPNFLVARVVDFFTSKQQGERRQLEGLELDLSCLRTIASGGEACSTELCRRFDEVLRRFGAREGVVVPGFGMTETGAGCIFNRTCPESDVVRGYEFTSVGRCVPGVEMRITSPTDEVSTLVRTPGEIGNLEIIGPLVFKGYLNNPQANAEAFTPDGWFRTGDMGFIDIHGNLVLTGRSKDVISINGVKHLLVDQERAIKDADIPGVVPDYVVCFAWRPSSAATEHCCIVYEHSYSVFDQESRLRALNMISQSILSNIGARPDVLPLPPGLLQKSSLGKLSRSKISQDFQKGAFAEHDALNSSLVNAAKAATIIGPKTPTEERVLNIVASVLHLEPTDLSTDAPLLDAGMTSVDMIRIRSAICREFEIPRFGFGALIAQHTVQSLAETISNSSSTQEPKPYQPVVQLKSGGSKPPLWLIHPGVGEVLVFVGLTQHLRDDDRPIFALRARGFEDGEEPFTSVEEVASTYAEAIRAKQPKGPYALAGYSYGAMLAFEVTKLLEADDDESHVVDFLGCFNLPPHIKARMRQLTLPRCLVHLAQFLELLRGDELIVKLENATDGKLMEEAIELVLASSDQARWRELDLTRDALARWAKVAFSLQSLAVDYEPSGNVRTMDVFYCDPLAFAARSKEEWLKVHLSKWREFCREEPGYHPVGGAHYTMLSPEHVRTFGKTLERVLSSRGV